MKNETRGRGWRRRQRAKHARRQETRQPLSPWEDRREKRWRLLYTRSVKLHRAAQLGRTYPRPVDEWSGGPLVY